MQKEKRWNFIGMLLGVFVIFIGIYFIFDPPTFWSTSSARSYTFGADYYTEQYEVTRVAAVNTAVTANNIRDLGIAISKYVGTAFVITGATMIIHYKKKTLCLENIVLPQNNVVTQECTSPENNSESLSSASDE